MFNNLKKSPISKILKGVFYIILFLVLLEAFVIAHESTHKYIAEKSGCNSTMYLNPFSKLNRERGSWSYTDYSCKLDLDEWERLKDREMNVEAVGYQIFPLYIIAVIILLILVDKTGNIENYRY